MNTGLNIKNIEKNVILWRYMNLSKFVSLLSTKSLWLARADTFKDQSEGEFHLEMRETLEEAYKNFDLYENDKIKNENDFQNYLIKNAYINCWHKNDHENMVMWEIYSQAAEAVAIKTSVGDLVSSIDSSPYRKKIMEFLLGEVDYTPSEQIKGKLTYTAPFFIKRPHFAYESEVRIFLSSYSSLFPSLETPLGYSIPINLEEGIHEVFVHPDAQDWFLKSVKDLINAFGVTLPVKKGICGNTLN